MKNSVADFLLAFAFPALLLLSVGCDPVHVIRLENKTSQNLEVVLADLPGLDAKVPDAETVLYRNRKMLRIVVKPGEFLPLGNVVARYQPRALDIDTDFLEIRKPTGDTISLIGKGAIFSLVIKEGRLDWRLLVR